ncbi:MAG: nucleotide exchange factor GrpE [Defluviitaleaceae bacterium]|nr:nucleotide exchange factor GrpE [Defluviitaleaceae bacterium]
MSAYPSKLAEMNQSVDNYTRLLTESMLYDLRQSVNARILAAGKRAPLDVRDDKIYDAYLRLIRHYKHALALYADRADVLVTPKLKSVFQGIEAVILSRLALCPDELPDELTENPLFLEKKRIIDEGILQFGVIFDDAAERFAGEQADACLRYARELFVTLDDIDYTANGLKLAGEIARRQDEVMLAELNNACDETIESCEERLRNCGSREEILRCREMLDAEREILDSLLKIQIPFNRACSPTESAVAAEIIAPVAEAYNALKQNLLEIHTHSLVEDEAEEDTRAGRSRSGASLWNRDMLGAVLAATNYDGFALSIESERAEVCRALEKDIGIAAEREISGKMYARAAYEYRKRAAEHELMASEMLEVFEKLSELEPVGGGDIYSIAEGINETLNIKVESLRENKQAFIDEMNKQLKELRRRQPRIELRELGELKPEIDMDARAAFFEKYRRVMHRYIADHQEYSGKKCREFLKESLLFEVITFGEIMNYSVSRMREDEDAGGFVRQLDEAWNILRDILNKNRITVIEPQPHEPFNGREHEILMAEKNPEFEKGEIIKLMNPGYRQDDVVLVRANVVAAM